MWSFQMRIGIIESQAAADGYLQMSLLCFIINIFFSRNVHSSSREKNSILKLLVMFVLWFLTTIWTIIKMLTNRFS